MPDQRPASDANSLRNRVRYRFDNMLSRGMWVVLVWLGAVTLAAVLLSALLLSISGVTFAGSEDGSFIEDFWQSLLRILDAGTMASDVGWGRRVLAIVITMFGILIAGTLIGLIATGIEQRVEDMQRGRSVVLESGHVVILGASVRLPVVVYQLALAAAGRKGNTVVILADGEPRDISEEVRAAVPEHLATRIVVRHGDPTRPADLEIVAIGEARAVIVLADEEAHGDTRVVKAVLATGTAMGGFGQRPIVAEMLDPGMAESLVRACGSSVHPVVAAQAVARTSIFALREPGLTQVVQELIDFAGSDIYLKDGSDLEGVPFGEIVFRYSDARPLGIARTDGSVEINPGPKTLFEPGERLVVLADNDGGFELATAERASTNVAVASSALTLAGEPRLEHMLIIGWNNLGSQILGQWDQFAAPDSSVEIVYDSRILAPDDIDIPAAAGLAVTLTPTTRPTWSLVDVAETSHLTSILLLGYRAGTPLGEADGRTLLNLMLVRRELDAWEGPTRPRVLVELLDAENVELARMTGADDYLVSDAIGSRIMAQLAEQPQRRAVYLALYFASGPSVHLVEAADLGLEGDVTMVQIVSAAYAAGLLAIGWRRAPAAGGEVVLNPRLSQQVGLNADDQIVVVG